MNKGHTDEVYDFLARKTISAEKDEQREILFFWIELIAGETEKSVATSGLDSDDKQEIRSEIQKWHHGMLQHMIIEMRQSQEEETACALRLKKAITIRIRHSIRDLVFGRTRSRQEKNNSQPRAIWRQGLRMSHISPEMQDTVFVDTFSDAETRYLCKEALAQEQNRQHRNTDISVEEKWRSQEVAAFLDKYSHFESLRIGIAKSAQSNTEG